MSGNNSDPNNDWVRLNVGGKLFQTTKDTLSRYPESFLACLVNGRLPSDKDETGAFLIDRNYKHFGTILDYLRIGAVNFDRKEKTIKDLLCEADFYNIKSLVDEIEKAMSPSRSETIMLFVQYRNNERYECEIVCSEKNDDYEVLQSLRSALACPNKENIQGGDGKYTLYDYDWGSDGEFIEHACLTYYNQIEVELILRSFGFVQESYDDNYDETDVGKSKCWKFVRTISK
ncbi:BTB/POZ domain-containing protein [Ditylenchus destructor]|nr:BTB/POZ domain-containing protein [Ditylenchus destructor]